MAVLIVAAAAALLLLVGGGGAAVAVVLWRLAKPQDAPVVANPAASTSSADPGNGAPPNAGANDPAKPPDKPSNPPPASALTKENFDKIDKGMTLDAVTALLGPETDIGRKPPEHDYVSGGTKVVVIVMRGQVASKSNNQGWPVAYPSDVAAAPPQPPKDKTPPPDKPPPTPKAPITQDLFNQIDKGMTMDQLVALAGKPTSVDDLRFANNPDVDTRVSWENFVADIGIRVDMVQGKVTSKSGYSHGKFWPVVYPSGPGAAPAKPAGALTRASFDKIDKGMGTDDVIALIGQPTATVKLDPAKFGGVDTEMTFISLAGDASVAATVDLFQGKVVKKSNPQSWPVVYPSEKGK
jgi:outer membrane protein assembly factor BamE (lipoprotein component of BamABCDE complex)